MSPSEARKKGKLVYLRPDWEDIKTQVMEEICRSKFEQNPNLKDKLLKTGEAVLQEGNTWNDKTWGMVDGVGENRLGKILMKLRDEFQKTPLSLQIKNIQQQKKPVGKNKNAKKHDLNL